MTDLVEYDPLDISDNICPAVEHAPENLSRHYEARGVRIHRNISGNKPHIVELLFKISVLLIGQGFDRRSVNCASYMSPR